MVGEVAVKFSVPPSENLVNTTRQWAELPEASLHPTLTLCSYTTTDAFTTSLVSAWGVGYSSNVNKQGTLENLRATGKCEKHNTCDCWLS